MKKFKILTLQTIGVVSLVTAPLATLCITSAASVSNEQLPKLTAAQKAIFDIDDATGTLKGFKKGSSKKEIAQYCKDGVCSLPTGIKAIGKDAFNMYKKIGLPEGVTKVVLPKTLTSIGDYAFYANPITEVAYEDEQKVDTIGNSAFSNCNKLKSFKFYGGLVSVGDSAFSGCTSLATLDFSSFIKMNLLLNVKFGNNAFSSGYLPGASSGNKGNVILNNEIQDDAAGSNTDTKDMHVGVFLSNLYASGLQGLYQKPASWILTGYTPAPIESTSYFPVPTQWLTTETINGVKTLTGIQPKHLADVKECNTLYIPSNIQAISDDFSYLNGTSKVSTKIGFRCLWCEDNSLTQIRNGLCKDNTAAKFGQDKALWLVKLPTKGLTTIGNNAFENCDKLKWININDIAKDTDTNAGDFETIGNSAFKNCVELWGFSFIEQNFSKLTLPSTVWTVGNEAFFGCNAIASLSLFVPPEPTESKHFMVGEKAFANLKGLTELDMSKLSYKYTTTSTGSKEIDRECTFRRWYDCAETASRIFGELPVKTDTNSLQMKLPFNGDVVVDPATFMDVKTKSDKEHAKEYSGFYWLCQQSMPVGKTDIKDSPVYNWVQTGEVNVSVDETTIQGSKTSSKEFKFAGPADYAKGEPQIEPVEGYTLGSTITFNNADNKVYTNETPLGDHKGVYLFRVKIPYTKESDTIWGYSDLITLIVGEELIFQSGAQEIIDEDNQPTHRDIASYVFKTSQDFMPQDLTYSFVEAESTAAKTINGLKIERQDADKTGLITWENNTITKDETKFRVKAYSRNAENGYFYEGYSPVITLKIHNARNLVIQGGTTSISEETGQKSQEGVYNAFTAKLTDPVSGQTIDITADKYTINWSVSDEATNNGITIDQNGALKWTSLNVCDTTFKVSLLVKENETEYTYSATTDPITLKVTNGRILTINNIADTIEHEYGQTTSHDGTGTLINATSVNLVAKLNDQTVTSSTGTIQWDIDQSAKDQGFEIGGTTGKLDWSNVNPNSDISQTVAISLKYTETNAKQYTYTAQTKNVVFKIGKQRQLTITGGTTSIIHETGQEGGTTNAYATALPNSKGVSSLVYSFNGGVSQNLSLNTTNGALTWGDSMTSGSVTVKADYTEATSGYKYSINAPAVTTKNNSSRSLDCTIGTVSTPYMDASTTVSITGIKIGSTSLNYSNLTNWKVTSTASVQPTIAADGNNGKITIPATPVGANAYTVTVEADYTDSTSGTKPWKYHLKKTFSFNSKYYTFTSDTWSHIATAAAQVEAGNKTLVNYYNNTVPAESAVYKKAVNVNGVSHNAILVARDYDVLSSDTSKKACFTWMLESTVSSAVGTGVKKQYSTSSSGTNCNVWHTQTDSSTARGYLRSTFKDNLLDTDGKTKWGSKIVTVKKKTNKGINCSAQTATASDYYNQDDTVFMPSIANVFTNAGIKATSDGDLKQIKEAFAAEETKQYYYFRTTKGIGDKSLECYKSGWVYFNTLIFKKLGGGFDSSTDRWFYWRSPYGKINWDGGLYGVLGMECNTSGTNNKICGQHPNMSTTHRMFTASWCL